MKVIVINKVPFNVITYLNVTKIEVVDDEYVLTYGSGTISFSVSAHKIMIAS